MISGDIDNMKMDYPGFRLLNSEIGNDLMVSW